jgi:hypothetical protein
VSGKQSDPLDKNDVFTPGVESQTDPVRTSLSIAIFLWQKSLLLLD